MTPRLVAALMTRELHTMRRELEAYPDDRLVWQPLPGLPNTGGTLALHAAGNLQHFVGAVLGRTGYVRDRDAEFARRDVPRAELLRELEQAIAVVERVLPGLPPAVLADWYPHPVAKRRVRTDEFLVHLLSHLAYHLGQLDYHRRAVTGDGRGVGAVAPAELPSAEPVSA
ncbi:MAG TPA: DinB family protein [Gemmatimonadaceae bacterium]